jgi:diguanylate cyclase (GGDEF)-like protein
MPLDRSPRLSSHAEILSWQSRLRILIAVTAGGAELLMLAGGSDVIALTAFRAAPIVLLATIAYVVLSAASGTIARRESGAPDWLVATTVCADVALIFALTIAVAAPAHYDRLLIIAFFALHLDTFYFGWRHGAAALALTLAGYSALVHLTITRGAALAWHEEIWSIAAFVFASAVVLVEQGSLRDRLASLARLFGRAEEGDFSEAYDEEGDARPDAITRVGRAYNRVRGQLASLVLTDALTACVNRRGFDQALTQEVARAGRSRRDVALLALDVDHFKMINDTLGHPAGDAVLKEVGALLMHAARAGDVVARTGGDEFSLILPDTSAQGALQLANRLCDALRAHRFASKAPGARLTVSVGVVAMEKLPISVLDAVETLKGRADEALYTAKRGGRDRVRLWTSMRAARSPAVVV